MNLKTKDYYRSAILALEELIVVSDKENNDSVKEIAEKALGELKKIAEKG